MINRTYLDRRSFTAGALAAPFVLTTRSVPVLGYSSDRVVSVGGSITETLYFLNRQELIVGVDTTSIYPREALSLPKVGYMRALSAEGILSLNPSMMIAESDAGPPQAMETLRFAGLDIQLVPDEFSLQGVLEKIRQVGALVDAADDAESLIQEVSSRGERATQSIATLSSRPRVLFVLSLRDGNVMAAGTGTAAEAIIDLAGGELAFTDYEGYRPVSLEALHESGPDVILLMEHVANELGGLDAIKKDGALATLDAAQNNRIVSMNGLLLLGFGPRTPDAVMELAGLLHGEGSISDVPEPLSPA